MSAGEVIIQSVGIPVPGRVVRKFAEGRTILTLTGEQAQSLYESLGNVVALFDSDDDSE